MCVLPFQSSVKAADEKSLLSSSDDNTLKHIHPLIDRKFRQSFDYILLLDHVLFCFDLVLNHLDRIFCYRCSFFLIYPTVREIISVVSLIH